MSSIRASGFRDWQLFAVCVLVWGTTWHAITFQIAALAPEYGVAVRFALAGGVVLALCAWRGERLRYPARRHALFALQGCFLYGLSYVCVYRAEGRIASGLVAVAYSASPLVSGLGASLLFGVAVGRRFVVGGVLGLIGVVFIFWPELVRPQAGDDDGSGTVATALAAGSVFLSAIGSVAASRNRRHGVAVLPAMGFGMLYGAAAALCTGLAAGAPAVLPTSAAWWLSLAWLALAGSVLAFACFMTLQERLGPGPAGTVGVMTPLLALVVSLLFEGYRPGWLTGVGAALTIAGNVLMLRPAAARLLRGGAAATE